MLRLSKRLADAAREAAVLLLFAAVAAGVSTWLRGGLPPMPVPEGQIEVTVEEARKLGPLWIDVRPQDRFTAEHVPGAVSLSISEYAKLLPAVLEKWEPDRPAVVYGDAPGEADSREVAARLCDFKLGRVCVLKGGWKAWKSR